MPVYIIMQKIKKHTDSSAKTGCCIVFSSLLKENKKEEAINMDMGRGWGLFCFEMAQHCFDRLHFTFWPTMNKDSCHLTA